VAVEKLPGVTGAEVSLENGVVTVGVTPDTPLTIAGLRKAIRNQGFSPRTAEVRVAGRLSRSPDGLVLSVPGSGEAYALTGDARTLSGLEDVAGGEVVLEGRIPEDQDDTTPGTLEVVSVIG
jgi:hypothetical protein